MNKHFENIIGCQSELLSGSTVSDGKTPVVQPVQLEAVIPHDVDTVLDMYYSKDDGTLPVNNGTKYLSKDTPPEIVEYIKQHVVRPLPPISGVSEELALEFPNGSDSDNVSVMQERYLASLKQTFELNKSEGKSEDK